MPDVFGSRIAVPATLELAGPDILNKANLLELELEAFKRRLAPLQEQWTGAAGSEYHGLQMEWDTAAADLLGPNGVLGMIAQAMILNSNNYNDCESANRQSWLR